MRCYAGIDWGLMSNLSCRSLLLTWGMCLFSRLTTTCISLSHSLLRPVPALPRVMVPWSTTSFGRKEQCDEGCSSNSARQDYSCLLQRLSSALTRTESSHNCQLPRQPGATVALHCHSDETTLGVLGLPCPLRSPGALISSLLGA